MPTNNQDITPSEVLAALKERGVTIDEEAVFDCTQADDGALSLYIDGNVEVAAPEKLTYENSLLYLITQYTVKRNEQGPIAADTWASNLQIIGTREGSR